MGIGQPTARGPHADRGNDLSGPPDVFIFFVYCLKKSKNTTKYTFPTFHSEITFPQCLYPCSMSSCTSCDHHGTCLVVYFRYRRIPYNESEMLN